MLPTVVVMPSHIVVNTLEMTFHRASRIVVTMLTIPFHTSEMSVFTSSHSCDQLPENRSEKMAKRSASTSMAVPNTAFMVSHTPEK